MLTVYRILLYLLLPFFFLRLLWKSRKNPAYRKRWSERLGFCPHSFPHCIWIHAVSLGETIAAIPLIKKLKLLYPDYPFLITNMTPTGSARAKAAFGDTVFHAHMPYDFPGSVSRFLNRVHPKIAIIMETEIWPNVLHACHQKHIPVFIANARLSEKSMRGYQRISRLTRMMLSEVSFLASQGKADAERFIQLGFPKEKMVITGNLKFDLELPKDLSEKSDALKKQLGDRFIWIAASTHPGEDEIILSAHHMLLKKNRNALLILVPRHPERFDSVYELIQDQSFSVVRRTSGNPCDLKTAVYLGDTVGELLLLYSVADVAFVAGSLVPVGGHNMLEPAALKKPIITGPHLFNFADISEWLLLAKGLFKIHDANELADTVAQFFDKDFCKTTGNNAFHVVEHNRGALQKQIDLIKKIEEET